MSHSERRTLRAVAGAVTGAVAVALLGIAEITSRLHQGGVAQLIGPAEPSWGADITQIGTLLIVALVAGAAGIAVLPRLGRLGAAVLTGVLVTSSIVGWLAFTEPTFVSFGESMELTVGRVLHAASTSVGTFVLAGTGLALAIRPARKHPTTTPAPIRQEEEA